MKGVLAAFDSTDSFTAWSVLARFWLALNMTYLVSASRTILEGCQNNDTIKGVIHV